MEYLKSPLTVFTSMIFFLLYGWLHLDVTNADLILMDPNGGPSIIENEIEPDVILVPGMGNLMIDDDLVL